MVTIIFQAAILFMSTKFNIILWNVYSSYKNTNTFILITL